MRTCLIVSNSLSTEAGNRYNKRHLAQEEHLKDTKSKEELEHAKSTIR